MLLLFAALLAIHHVLPTECYRYQSWEMFESVTSTAIKKGFGGLTSSSATNDQQKYKFPLSEYQYHGTTTLAFKCEDGIIVAVDSRATMGEYVGSRTVKKIFPISNKIVGTMAGGAADCSHWIRLVARKVHFLERHHSTKLPVSAVAKILADTLRDLRGSGKFYCGNKLELIAHMHLIK